MDPFKNIETWPDVVEPKCSIAHLQLACCCLQDSGDYVWISWIGTFEIHRIETNPNEHATASPFPKGWDVQDNVRKDNELHVFPTWLPTRRRCSPRRKSFSMSSITIMCWTEIQKRKRERVTNDAEFTHSHWSTAATALLENIISLLLRDGSPSTPSTFQSKHPAPPDRNQVISKVEHPPYSLHTRAFSF